MYEQLQSAVVETETVWPNIHNLLFTEKFSNTCYIGLHPYVLRHCMLKYIEVKSHDIYNLISVG